MVFINFFLLILVYENALFMFTVYQLILTNVLVNVEIDKERLINAVQVHFIISSC